MADVTPRVGADALIIQSYDATGFRISGEAYKGAVLLVGTEIHAIDIKTPQQMDERHFSKLKGKDVTYLILGCGAKSIMPPLHVLQDLGNQRIVAEAMSTPAACRTFNVLVAEGRQVAALLLPG